MPNKSKCLNQQNYNLVIHTHAHAHTSIRVSVGKAIDKQTVAAAAEAAQTN